MKPAAATAGLSRVAHGLGLSEIKPPLTQNRTLRSSGFHRPRAVPGGRPTF
jgi:hypothetical protein